MLFRSNIALKIAFEEGYGAQNLREEIEKSVSEYLLELRKKWGETTAAAVRISQIETRILAVKGVVDVGGTRLNGAEKNLLLDNLQIPVLGGIDIGSYS